MKNGGIENPEGVNFRIPVKRNSNPPKTTHDEPKNPLSAAHFGNDFLPFGSVLFFEFFFNSVTVLLPREFL
jgi:hypothetical protein